MWQNKDIQITSQDVHLAVHNKKGFTGVKEIL